MSESTLAAVLEAAAQPNASGQREQIAPPATPGLTAADVEAARNDGHSAGYAAAQACSVEIVDMCAIAGKPEMATAFIKDGKTVADVRGVLLSARAEGAEPIDGTIPAATAQAGGVDLAADMRRRAGQA